MLSTTAPNKYLKTGILKTGSQYQYSKKTLYTLYNRDVQGKTAKEIQGERNEILGYAPGWVGYWLANLCYRQACFPRATVIFYLLVEISVFFCGDREVISGLDPMAIANFEKLLGNYVGKVKWAIKLSFIRYFLSSWHPLR